MFLHSSMLRENNFFSDISLSCLSKLYIFFLSKRLILKYIFNLSFLTPLTIKLNKINQYNPTKILLLRKNYGFIYVDPTKCNDM